MASENKSKPKSKSDQHKRKSPPPTVVVSTRVDRKVRQELLKRKRKFAHKNIAMTVQAAINYYIANVECA